MDTVMNKTHELGKAITEDARHTAWLSAKEAHDNDETLQGKILSFNTVRNNLMTANTAETRDEEKIAALSAEMRTLYDEVMGNPVMATFLEKQQDVNTLVAEVTELIQFYVTGEEPDSCGGSCSSCSGCH